MTIGQIKRMCYQVIFNKFKNNQETTISQFVVACNINLRYTLYIKSRRNQNFLNTLTKVRGEH